MITVSGLGSGLDIESLVTQLIDAERQAPEQRLNSRESIAQAKLSAFGVLSSSISGLQSLAAPLDTDDFWSQLSSTSTDEDAVAITTSTGASVGSYSLAVGNLASAQALASAAVADLDTTELGTGSLTIRFGNTAYDSVGDVYSGFTENLERDSITVDIDSGNNTLQGIRDAINDTNAGVSAAIVNDGSGFRLLLSSEFTGADNSLEIVAADDDGNANDTLGLSQFAFNSAGTQLQQTVAAADAAFTINGLSITSASNTVDGALQNVILDLKSTTTSPVSLSVSRDLTSMEAGINSFVNEYNKLQEAIDNIAGYDPGSQQAGILSGDFTARSISDRINGILRSSVGGSNAIQSLSELGITTQSDGLFALDNSRLQEALQNNLQDVKALFVAVGTPSDSGVTFQGNSSATATGDYAVEITQLATSGSLIGTTALPDFGAGGSVIIDSDNDGFTISVDGDTAVGVLIAQGTYTDGASLATAIETAINAAVGTQGKQVGVLFSAVTNNFEIASTSFGTQSTVEISAVDLNSSADLGLNIGIGSAGLNIAGTIGGQAAQGSGKTLTGAAGSLATGLELLIGTDTLGSAGTVSFNRGLANQLDSLLDDYLAADGLIENRTEGLRGQIEDTEDQREVLERRLEAIEIRYRNQFTGLDLLLTQLQTTSDFLTQQLANLPAANSNKS